MKITYEDYKKECEKHKNKRGGCMSCKFYDNRWITTNIDTWCKIANAIGEEKMREWDNRKYHEHNSKN